MVINTNISALNSATLLMQSSQRMDQSLAKLSSGSKIVTPADDAAGLAESMRTNAQILGTNAANNNLANASSFSQTQDGYLQQVGSALDRMSELAVQAQDVTKSDADRSLYNREFQTLHTYVNSIQNQEFNGVSLFGGNALNVTTDANGGTFQMQGISANFLSATATTPASTPLTNFTSQFANNPIPADLFVGDDADTVNVDTDFSGSSTIQDLLDFFNNDTHSLTSATYNPSSGQFSVSVAAHSVIYDYAGGLKNMGFTPTIPSPVQGFPGEEADVYGDGSSVMTFTATLGSGTSTSSSLDISTTQDAASALTQIQTALTQVAGDRATIGANMERLNFSSGQLDTLSNNLSAANSLITDVDVATESTTFARENILVQAGTSMLAQANTLPQSVLHLLG